VKLEKQPLILVQPHAGHVKLVVILLPLVLLLVLIAIQVQYLNGVALFAHHAPQVSQYRMEMVRPVPTVGLIRSWLIRMQTNAPLVLMAK